MYILSDDNIILPFQKIALLNIQKSFQMIIIKKGLIIGVHFSKVQINHLWQKKTSEWEKNYTILLDMF